MNRLQRPTTGRAEWEARADVQQAMAKVAAKATNNTLTRKDVPALWAGERAAWLFQGAQQGICGYCASRMDNAAPHLDHYRPIVEVSRRVKTPGQEIDGLVNMKGRQCSPAIRPGYWWLAYDWDNFIVACERCNSGWKGTLFPVHGRDERVPPSAQPEKALLLNPFEITNPLEHLDFDDHGNIAGRTEQGRATIDVCGLDRPSLQSSRRRTALTVELLLDDLERPGLPIEQRTRVIQHLVDAGAWSQPHAAVIRALVHRREMSWSDLEAEASEHS